tara:strand:+ start:58 stop:1482 length:1425 start_codon:yes stop_codon:yes gene_type:complete
MGVAFTNNWELLIDKLQSVLSTEFGQTLKIYSSIKDITEASQYLQIKPAGSDSIEYYQDSEIREFSLSLELHYKNQNIKNRGFAQIMLLTSRVEEVISNNPTLTLSDNSKAHNCRIESTEINKDDPDEYIVNMDFKCVHANSSLTPALSITASQVSSGVSSTDEFLSLTFTLNRDSNNFAASDVDVTNGVLSSFSGSGSVYTATFTPSALGATTIRVLADKFTGINATGANTASNIFNWTYVPAIRSLELNGTDEYVSFGDIDELEDISVISLAFWIKFKSVTESHEIITKGRYVHSTASWAIEYESINKRLEFSIKNARFAFEDLPDLAADTWYHIGATYSNATDAIALYLNGSALSAYSAGSYIDVPNTTKEVKVGVGDKNNYGNFYIGYVGIWTDFLSAAEITAIYNSGNRNVPLNLASNSGDYTSAGDLECFWKFNESSGFGTDAVTDYSGNGHAGTTFNTDNSNWIEEE